MPRTPDNARAHTRAMNRAAVALRHNHPEEFRRLYDAELHLARAEAADHAGLTFRPGPRNTDGPTVDLDEDCCTTGRCPVCGTDTADPSRTPGGPPGGYDRTNPARLTVLLQSRCARCGKDGRWVREPCPGQPRHTFVLIKEPA